MDNIIDFVHRKSHKLMSDEQFWRKLREVIFLLIGLHIFNAVIVMVAPFIIPSEWMSTFGAYSSWIVQVIFGVIITSKLHQQKNAISIGLLAIMTPAFGGLFYLMITTLTKPSNDNQKYNR